MTADDLADRIIATAQACGYVAAPTSAAVIGLLETAVDVLAGQVSDAKLAELQEWNTAFETTQKRVTRGMTFGTNPAMQFPAASPGQ
jgi:hypothetical protein